MVLPKPEQLCGSLASRAVVAVFDTAQGRSIPAPPYMSVLDAVVASCSAPSYFEPPGRYIDGGLGANLPTVLAKSIWPEEKACFALPNGGLYQTQRLSDSWDWLAIPNVIEALTSGQVDQARVAGRLLFPDHYAEAPLDFAFNLGDFGLIDALLERGFLQQGRLTAWAQSFPLAEPRR